MQIVKATQLIPLSIAARSQLIMVGLDYELLKFHVKQMILKIQSAYVSLQQEPPILK